MNEKWVVDEIIGIKTGTTPVPINPTKFREEFDESLEDAIDNVSITINESGKLVSHGGTSVYSVTPTQPEHGSILIDLPCVLPGYAITATITADAHYVIDDVLVDGTSVGAVSEYVFSNMQANHTISATVRYVPIYGFIYDGDISSPSNAVTFTDDAATLTAEQRKALVYSWIDPTVVKDGVIQYKLKRDNLAKKEDGETDADLTGTDGDVCASFKQVWWAFSPIAGTNKVQVKVCREYQTGYITGHVFNGTVREYNHLGMFEATGSTCNSVYSTSLHPTANQTLNTFRTQANTKNAALSENLYSPVTYLTWQMYQILFILAYGTLNSQTAGGAGWTNSGHTASCAVARSELLTCSGEYISGGDNSQNMALFVANPWGNVWEFRDQCMWNGGAFALSTDQNQSYNIESGWAGKPSGWEVINSSIGTGASSSYIKTFMGTNYGGFFPKTTGGDSASYACDACWSNTGERCCFVGASWDSGALAGVFAVGVNHALAAAVATVGARLQILNAT